MHSRILLAAACLLPMLRATAAPETLISVDLVDVPLVDAIKAIAAEGELQVIIGPLNPEPGKVTVAFSQIEARSALERLLRVQPSLELVDFDDMIVVRQKSGTAQATPRRADAPVSAMPPRPDVRKPQLPGGPASMPGVNEPSERTGAPMVGSKRYYQIPIHYAYAPGLAEALGGRGLRLSDIDPWVGSMASGLGAGRSGQIQGQGNGFGGGNSQGVGGNSTGFGGNGFGQSQAGRGVFQLPDGIDELVGVDWTGSMVAR